MLLDLVAMPAQQAFGFWPLRRHVGDVRLGASGATATRIIHDVLYVRTGAPAVVKREGLN